MTETYILLGVIFILILLLVRVKMGNDNLRTLCNEYAEFCNELKYDIKSNKYHWYVTTVDLWKSRAQQRDTAPEQDKIALGYADEWQKRADKVFDELANFKRV